MRQITCYQSNSLDGENLSREQPSSFITQKRQISFTKCSFRLITALDTISHRIVFDQSTLIKWFGIGYYRILRKRIESHIYKSITSIKVRGHNWVLLSDRPWCTFTLNSNFAILKTNFFTIKKHFFEVILR